MVNWFRQDADGKFIWPGFGENMRVLRWMLDRIHGRVGAIETPAGGVPDPADLDLTGLEIAPDTIRQALAVDPKEWKAEMESAGELFDKIGPTMPADLKRLRAELSASLDAPTPLPAPPPPADAGQSARLSTPLPELSGQRNKLAMSRRP